MYSLPFGLLHLVLYLIYGFPFNSNVALSHSQNTASPQSLPCEQIVFVEPQADAPILISPMRCEQDKPQSVSVEFNVINKSDKRIIAYTIVAKAEHTDYKPPKGDRFQVRRQYPQGQALLPGWSTHAGLGGGTLTKTGGIPVGPLTEFKLYVESVMFDGGKLWLNMRQIDN